MNMLSVMDQYKPKIMKRSGDECERELHTIEVGRCLSTSS